LAWKDNIPLLSFVLLKGRCRYCHSPISRHYPIVELAAAGLTLLVFQYTSEVPRHLGGVGTLLIVYCLLTVFVSDLRYLIIPDEVLVFAAVVALLAGMPLGNLLPAAGAAGFFWLLIVITKGKGMGWGDVKLAGLMGLILGWPQLLAALFLAFLTGAVVGAILILLGKKKFGQHIPFGPFLATSTFISLFWGETIWVQIAALL